mmetsp:Transcript_17542/g.45006  ORF Transcript_17542/g.45006 Transcript_17542/m.45006 type:complete len:211 (+) Transcript_17542:297-929(+)
MHEQSGGEGPGPEAEPGAHRELPSVRTPTTPHTPSRPQAFVRGGPYASDRSLGVGLLQRTVMDGTRGARRPGAPEVGYAERALKWLMRPLVEASCEVTSPGLVISGKIFFASSLPSSTPHWSNELISHRIPCVKILCSYMAMSAPRVRGVSLSNMIEFVGLLPGKTLCGARNSTSSADLPALLSSARTSSSVLPFMSASVCAKKLERRIG